MKFASTVIALAIASALVAACDRPKTQGTAYNNSGNSAAPTSTESSTTTTTTTAPSTPTTTADSTSTGTNNPTPSSTPTGSTDTGAVGDTVTTGKIKAAIASDPSLKDADVTVATSGGVVTVSGTVKSQDQIPIVVALVQKQEGVSKVENNLAVK